MRPVRVARLQALVIGLDRRPLGPRDIDIEVPKQKMAKLDVRKREIIADEKVMAA